MAQPEADLHGGNTKEQINPPEGGIDGTLAKMSEDVNSSTMENGAIDAEQAEGATDNVDDPAVEGNQEELESQSEAVPMTRVGIEYNDSNVTWFQDWSVRDVEPTPHSQLAGQFDISVALNGDITLLSPFLVNTFREVVKYFPGTLNEGTPSIVISKPYAALYHYWDDIRLAIEAQLGNDVLNGDKEMAQEGNEDQSAESVPTESELVKESIRSQLEKLSLVYKTLCATDHDEVRELIRNNLITFKNLWALYKPGELLLSKDEFGEPVLHSFTACAMRSGMSIRMLMAVAMSHQPEDVMKGPGLWNVDGWCVQWDSSTRTFTRQLKTFAVNYFPGAKTIISIEPSPLSFHSDSYKGQDLARMLEDRGEKWRRLITLPPTCQMYQGPAFRILTNSHKIVKDRTNVSSPTSFKYESS